MYKFLILLFLSVIGLPIFAQENTRFIRIGAASVYSGSFLAAQNLAIQISFEPQYSKKGVLEKSGIIAAAQSFSDYSAALQALINGDVETAIVPSEYLYDTKLGNNTYNQPKQLGKEIVAIASVKPLVGYFIARKYIKKLERKYLTGLNLATTPQGSLGFDLFNKLTYEIGLNEGEFVQYNKRIEDLYQLFADNKIDGFFIFDIDPIPGIDDYLERNNAHLLPFSEKLSKKFQQTMLTLESSKFSKSKINTIAMPLVWVSLAQYSSDNIKDIIPKIKQNIKSDLMTREITESDLSVESGKKIIKLEQHDAIKNNFPSDYSGWLKSLKKP